VSTDEEREDYSWAEVAERGDLCPSSPEWTGPHLPAGDGTCRECGQTIDADEEHAALVAYIADDSKED
jgi:hypothetical protein